MPWVREIVQIFIREGKQKKRLTVIETVLQYCANFFLMTMVNLMKDNLNSRPNFEKQGLATPQIKSPDLSAHIFFLYKLEQKYYNNNLNSAGNIRKIEKEKSDAVAKPSFSNFRLRIILSRVKSNKCRCTSEDGETICPRN